MFVLTTQLQYMPTCTSVSNCITANLFIPTFGPDILNQTLLVPNDKEPPACFEDAIFAAPEMKNRLQNGVTWDDEPPNPKYQKMLDVVLATYWLSRKEFVKGAGENNSKLLLCWSRRQDSNPVKCQI